MRALAVVILLLLVLGLAATLLMARRAELAEAEAVTQREQAEWARSQALQRRGTFDPPPLDEPLGLTGDADLAAENERLRQELEALRTQIDELKAAIAEVGEQR